MSTLLKQLYKIRPVGPQYITVFITRVTGLPLFTERDLVKQKGRKKNCTVHTVALQSSRSKLYFTRYARTEYTEPA